jgi:XisH protein
MSAKDIFHDVVKEALQREQWIVTHDPLRFKYGDYMAIPLETYSNPI